MSACNFTSFAGDRWSIDNNKVKKPGVMPKQQQHPGHKGILGNEAADELAKSPAATIHLICQRESPLSVHHHRPSNQQTPNDHGVRAFLLGGQVAKPHKAREYAVLKVRLGAGHAPLLKALDSATGPKCPMCMKEPKTVEYCLQGCPNVFTAEKVLALTWATFLSRKRPPQHQ